MEGLSPVFQVIFAAASTEAYVLYSRLPRVVKEQVNLYLADMAETQKAETEFERTLVEMNPAPDRVSNHYKWRATQPVRVRLKVPRFQLEMQLVRSAYPERKLDAVDLSDMVLHLRAVGDEQSVIDLVEQVGIEGLAALVKRTFPRVSSVDLSVNTIVDRYRRYTYNPIRRLISEQS